MSAATVSAPLSGRAARLVSILAAAQSSRAQRASAARELPRVVAASELASALSSVSALLVDLSWDVRVCAADTWAALLSAHLARCTDDPALVSLLRAELAHTPALTDAALIEWLAAQLSGSAPVASSTGASAAPQSGNDSALRAEVAALEAQLSAGVSARLKHGLQRKLKELQQRLGSSTPASTPSSSSSASSSSSSSSSSASSSSESSASPFAASVLAALRGLADASSWQRRHGCALVLRALCSSASSASSLVSVCAQLCSLLVARVLSERFGDFVGDVAVLPVQEALVQALAASAALLAAPLRSALWSLLRAHLHAHNALTWHARHGAYSAARYVLALGCTSAQVEELCTCVSATLAAAGESEDVKMAALSALQPLLARTDGLPARVLEALWASLWALLHVATASGTELSEASVSALCAPVLALLVRVAALLGASSALRVSAASMRALIALLLHRVAVVRSAALDALGALVSHVQLALLAQHEASQWRAEAMHALCALLLDDALHALHDQAAALWHTLGSSLPANPDAARAELGGYLATWLRAACTLRACAVDMSAWPAWARVEVLSSFAMHVRLSDALSALWSLLVADALAVASQRPLAVAHVHVLALTLASRCRLPSLLASDVPPALVAALSALVATSTLPPPLLESEPLVQRALELAAPLLNFPRAQLDLVRASSALRALPSPSASVWRALSACASASALSAALLALVRASAATALLTLPAHTIAVHARHHAAALLADTLLGAAPLTLTHDDARLSLASDSALNDVSTLVHVYAKAVVHAVEDAEDRQTALEQLWAKCLNALDALPPVRDDSDVDNVDSDTPASSKGVAKTAPLKRAREEDESADAGKRARTEAVRAVLDDTSLQPLLEDATVSSSSSGGGHVDVAVSALLVALSSSSLCASDLCALLIGASPSERVLRAWALSCAALVVHVDLGAALVGALTALTLALAAASPAPSALLSSPALVRALVALTRAAPVLALAPVLRLLLALLARVGDVETPLRVFALKVLLELLLHLEDSASTWAPLLALPCLARMSDSDERVRRLAARAFARLLALVALEGASPPSEVAAALLSDAALKAQLAEERAFLAQLLDARLVSASALPVGVLRASVSLRAYQSEGVAWLRFLQRYGLHGVLADDMGLGKTLQTLTALALSHHHAPTRAGSAEPAVSLVLCPPTLLAHWVDEAQRMCQQLPAHVYRGTPDERAAVLARARMGEVRVVVASYETLRREHAGGSGSAQLSAQAWRYVVLDEGHVIRNARTQLAHAVRSLRAEHRLLLSGTPLQNRVDDLWALFDFLMPGFLGTHAHFNAKYARPIAKSQGAPEGSAEARGGEEALRALHKQVLPFILRREKAVVARDLPPKLLMDRYCEPSPLQRQLLADLDARKEALALAAQSDGAESAQSADALRSLQYMRKLCTHPRLVLPERTDLDALDHAPKFTALLALLEECGLVRAQDDEGDDKAAEDSAGHRVLIFAQMRASLDLVEALFRARCPSLRYLRLDGNTPATQRVPLCTEFNSDPGIGAMLLTTAVGGLGLNLASADTVIFLEHDWNPQKDVQAMDRAHRLTSTRTVSVYRILLRDTIEERVLGLQAFKLKLASAVVTEDNRALASMDASRVVDMFESAAQTSSREADANAAVSDADAEAAAQYAREFDLDAFLRSVKK